MFWKAGDVGVGKGALKKFSQAIVRDLGALLFSSEEKTRNRGRGGCRAGSSRYVSDGAGSGDAGGSFAVAVGLVVVLLGLDLCYYLGDSIVLRYKMVCISGRRPRERPGPR